MRWRLMVPARRAGRLGDGYFPSTTDPHRLTHLLELMRNIHQPPPPDRGTVGVRRDGALVDARGGE
jgi:hypothetical protein